jgi:hypothetical protein
VEGVFELPIGRGSSREPPRERQPSRSRRHQSLNAVANCDLEMAVGVFQFLDVDRGFALAADIDERHFSADRDDRALERLALLDALRLERSLEHHCEIFGWLGHGTLLITSWAQPSL